MSKTITVRVQSPDHGTRRLETKGNESTSSFLNKVQKEFGLGDTGWMVYTGRDFSTFIRNSRAKKVDDYKIRHGDMLYMKLEERAQSAAAMETEAGEGALSFPASTTDAASASASGAPAPSSEVQEDEVDSILSKQDGKIYRSRNEQFCRHGPKGKCLHCVPLEPYDEQFLKSCDPPIKFLSFHSYLRKLTGGVDKGKFVNLENISCKIKPGCKEHPPWPGGICTKCQPNAVTLNRQTYRHVDYIMFENPMVADRLLNYWRSTGNQRIGILYGRYEPHKDVPLGIKATVAAIYEPPQVNSPNRVELQEDVKEDQVTEVAKGLGLVPVGWIFLDLVADDLSKGTVKNFRGNIDSHFLSAEECIMAASFQNKHPNPCKLAREGHFGSKFVTVIATGGCWTGDNNNQIHFEGYQVSNQCMALVNDDCLIPTKDVPELGYVKESSNEQYVPDVFYKGKDSYGNEVTHLARPLPVEYLLVDMPAAFPSDFQYTFKTHDGMRNFPAENREQMGETQDFGALVQYMQQFSPSQFLAAMSDFHLLVFLCTSEIIPVREKMGMLLEAVKNQDEQLALQFKKTEEWATVEEMMSAHDPSPRQASYVGPGAAPLPPIGGGSSSAMWTCAHCTFLNPPGLAACEMCSLPHSSGPAV